MLLEAEAIPYAPSRLIGERLLVLAPHPDDEVIGCGGVVAQHLAEGRVVRVVVATDGTAATETGDPVEYRARRQAETRASLALLGAGATVEFLEFPDRELDSARIAPQLAAILLDFRPDLILVPGLVEIHPDHVALARGLCSILQSDASLAPAIAVARIAFYEVGNPLRPNALVDITAEAEAKFEAIAAHRSQMELRDYAAVARGLNAFRAMSLGPDVRFAEAYWVTSPATVSTTATSQLRLLMGMPPEIEVASEPLPLSVIVRTKDRPALLAEAIASIRATQYPAEIIVVNDGGSTPPPATGVRVVTHEQSRGRSVAMNSGVDAAQHPFIAFLDDDDLYYEEHLATLASAAQGSTHAAWYTDAVSAFLRPGSSGRHETHSRLRLFAHDYDADLLLLDNYIPLPTLLLRRADFLAAGGFDPAFDLFEDWDFLVRLSRLRPFLHIPRITCEVRHFEAGDSIMLSAPEGSAAFRRAKLQVWAKHAALMSPDTIASAFELQKKRAGQLLSASVEAAGRTSLAEREVARYEREKQDLIGQVGARHRLAEDRAARIHELEGAMRFIRGEMLVAQQHAASMERELTEGRTAIEQRSGELRAAYAEIGRLQGLLDMIFASKTWKLHTTIEKLKGR